MTYPYPAVFEGYERKREHLRGWARRHYVQDFGLSPGRLLDVGCGEGFWGAFFSEWGFEVDGFDAEPAYIETGREKYPDLELIVARAEDDLPYDDHVFDVVFIRAISHFYAPDLEPARAILEHLRRYVIEDGLLLVSAYTSGKGDERPGQFGDVVHTHHPVNALVQMIEGAGWQMERKFRNGYYLQIGAR